MNSDTPKVMHTLGGEPMIDHVIKKAKMLKPFKISIMINKSLSGLKKIYPDLQMLLQEPQLGTGHAVQIFQKKNKLDNNSKLIVLYGDNPLIDLHDLKNMNAQLAKKDVVIMGFKPKTEQNPNGNDDFGGYLIGSQAGISNRIKEALITVSYTHLTLPTNREV